MLGFPGPDRSIRPADFAAGQTVCLRYRNRRASEFVKELDRTEGRSTGVPKMVKALHANGSPLPVFYIDDYRVFYPVQPPVRPSASVPQTPRISPNAQGTTDVTPEVTPEVRRVCWRWKAEKVGNRSGWPWV